MAFFTVINTVKMKALYIGFPLALDERHVDPTTFIVWLEYKQVQALFTYFKGYVGYFKARYTVSNFRRELLESSPPRFPLALLV